MQIPNFSKSLTKPAVIVDVVMGIFIIGGLLYMLVTHAATYSMAVETEKGQASTCAVKVADPAASSGSAVSFTACTPPTPTQHINLAPLVSGLGTNQTLTLAAAYYDFRDFAYNTYFGIDLPNSVSIKGAGVDQSILEMVPNSSTKAHSIPTASGTTNQFSLIHAIGTPIFDGFTLKGTSQGHLYNGLRLSRTVNARVSNIKVTGIPGNSTSPPGETFGINDYGTTGSAYSNIEIDGSAVGASGFATNSSKNVIIQNSYLHDSAYAHGAAFWETDGITITNVKSVNNKSVGFNFERTTGTVTMRNITVGNNGLADVRVGNDHGSAVFNIYDPVYTGAKLRVLVAPIYNAVTNIQKRSDIHVYIKGVDETSQVVQWL